MYTLVELQRWGVSAIGPSGKWYPVRPVKPPLIYRIKDAIMVLRWRADAFTWPEIQ